MKQTLKKFAASLLCLAMLSGILLPCCCSISTPNDDYFVRRQIDPDELPDLDFPNTMD